MARVAVVVRLYLSISLSLRLSALCLSVDGDEPAGNATAVRQGKATGRGRAVTPKRTARSARSTGASVTASTAVQSPQSSSPQSPQSRSGRRRQHHAASAHQRTRVSAAGSDVALHLSGEERREREREAILLQLQDAMHSKRKIFGHSIEDPQQVFKAFDRDGSGTLTPDEFYEALKRLGLGLGDAQLGRLLSFLDVDGDGEIDYGELLAFLSGEHISETPSLPVSVDGDEPAGNATAVRQWKATGRGRAVTPKRTARSARSTGASVTASTAVQSPQSSSPQSPQSRSGRRRQHHAASAHQRTRVSAAGSDVALHLSGEERREREREAILLQLQDAMHSKRKIFGHSIEDPQQVFKAFDRDGSGTLTPDEFYEALKRLGLGLGDAQLGRLLSFLDVDGDGEIDYGELLAFLSGEHISETPPLPTSETFRASLDLPETQSHWRVQLAQRAMEEADEEERRIAASKVQARWRGNTTRKAIQDGNWDALPFDWLASELACGDERARQDLGLVANLTEPRPDYYAPPPDLITIGANGGWEAAENIQRTFRGYHGRRRAQSLRNTASATHIQRMQRGRQQRHVYQHQQQSAKQIQRHYRGLHGRKLAQQKLERDTRAARTIQRVHRGHRGRHRYHAAQLEAKQEQTCATRIQASYRGHRDRVRLPQLAHTPAWQERERRRAAVKVQSYARSSRVQRQLVTPECSGLKDFLQTANLGRFFGTMFENGIGSISQMDALTADEMLKLGMQRKDIKKLRHYRLLRGPDNARLKRVHRTKLADEDEECRRNAQAAAVGIGKAAAQAAREKAMRVHRAQELKAAEEERDILMLAGEAQIKNDDCRDAVESLTSFLAHPLAGDIDKARLAYAYHLRGHCLQLLGNTDAAEDDYTAGIALAGECGYALRYHRGRLRIALGDIDGAREDLNEAQPIQSTSGPLGPSAVFPDRHQHVSTVTLSCPEGVVGGETIIVDLGDKEISEVVPENLQSGDEWDLLLDDSPPADTWIPPKLTLLDSSGSQDWSYEIKHDAEDTSMNVIGRAVQKRSSKIPRGPADCLLDASDMTIARRHAKIAATRQRTVAERPDMTCEISCFEPQFVHVNSDLVRGSASRQLEDRDVIAIGSTKLLFTSGYWQTHLLTPTSIEDLMHLCNRMEEEGKEEVAATNIQARVRGNQIRHLMKQTEAEAEAVADMAAVTIQSRARGYLVRCRRGSDLTLQPEPEPELDPKLEVQMDSILGRTITVIFEHPGPLGLGLSTADPLDAVWQNARNYDTNGDGVLEREEIKRVLIGMGRLGSPEDVDSVFQQMDTNHDGHVDIKEFEDWYKMQEHPNPDELKPPVRVDNVTGYAESLGLEPGLHILAIEGQDSVRHDVRDATLREVNMLIKSAGRPVKIAFSPAETDVEEYSTPRGRLHRDRKAKASSSVDGGGKKLSPAATHGRQRTRAKSPGQSRRWPSKPRVDRMSRTKAKISAVNAFMTSNGSTRADTRNIPNEAQPPPTEYDRAIRKYDEVLAKGRKYNESRYYETEAAAKVAELHAEYIDKLNDEIAHAKLNLAGAEAQLGDLDSGAAAALEAKQFIEEERVHLQELTETRLILMEEEEEIHAEEIEAEMATLKQAYAAELLEAKTAVEAAKAAQAAVASDNNEPDETKNEIGSEYIVDGEGFVTVAIPDGVKDSSMQIDLKGDTQVEVQIPSGLTAGDTFEVYIGSIAEDPEPTATRSTSQIDGRRRPRTPGKTQPNRAIFSCGASPRPGAEVKAPTPMEAVNDRPDSESDHDAEIAKFLAQHQAREQGPSNDVALQEAEHLVPTESSQNPLSLSPVRQPSQTQTFNLNEAVSAGLSILQSTATEVDSRTPVSTQLQTRPVPASFNATARTTASSQSTQWLPPPTSSSATLGSPGWGVTPVTARATKTSSSGKTLGAGWGSQPAARQQSSRPEPDLSNIDAAFKPRAGAGVIGGVSSRTPTAGGVRRFAPPPSRQVEQARQNSPINTSLAKGLSPSAASRRAVRKDHPNSYTTDAERERMQKRLDAEKRSREQHFQVFGGSR